MSKTGGLGFQELPFWGMRENQGKKTFMAPEGDGRLVRTGRSGSTEYRGAALREVLDLDSGKVLQGCPSGGG